jgi:cell fate regulator YaaT (PSP1 superfamily)
MVKVVGVKFKGTGKLYYFAPTAENYEKDMGVIVETARGVEFATVVVPLREVADDQIVAPLKPIIRIANQKDYDQLKRNEDRKPSAMQTAEEKIAKNKLPMKLIDCEFTFDGSKVIFYFTADGRVDFRELVKDLSAVFHMRIELRQVGIRDEIKIIGGLAPCGRECCCGSCMPDFKKVSIKMAKNQGLSLNPTKISGLCGRLMCCLAYENDYYASVYKKMPKVGSEVTTPEGKGTVININMLKMQVKVKIEDKQKDTCTYHDFPVSDIKFKRNNAQDEKDDEKVDEELKKILD